MTCSCITYCTRGATIYHHTALLQYHPLHFLCCSFFPLTYSFHRWKSVPPTPLHSFCPSSHLLPRLQPSICFLYLWGEPIFRCLKKWKEQFESIIGKCYVVLLDICRRLQKSIGMNKLLTAFTHVGIFF